MTDRVVVLRSTSGKHAAKQFTKVYDKQLGADRIDEQPFGNERFYQVEEIIVGNFTEMCAAFDRVERDPLAFVIRGTPKPDINRNHTRRLAHPDRRTGDPATFEPIARHWLLLDFDHLPPPPLTDIITNPVDAMLHLAGLLPPEFRYISFRWQLSSSQGLPDSENFLSAHLGFWSYAPLSDVELIRWANFINRQGRLIDPAVFRTVQPNYLAVPLFHKMSDPLPVRSGVWRGLEDTVEVIIPPPDRRHPTQVSGQGYEPGIGVRAFLAKIGGAEGFREPIKSAIGSYIATYSSKADCEPLKRAIRAAIDAADVGGRSADILDRYKSDEHLDAIIDWIRTQHGDQPPKGSTPEPPDDFDDDAPPPPEPDGDLPPPPREVVRTGGGRLPLAIDEAERILIANDPDVYVFGDRVVRPAPQPIQIADDQKTTGLRLVPIGPEHMADRLTRIIDFQKYDGRSKKWVSCDCPLGLAKGYLARNGLWKLRKITALTTCPLLLPGGRILDKPGYDAPSGILFDDQGIQFPSVPCDPTREEALESLQYLTRPFGEYPFVDEASVSVLRSLLLTSVSRLAFPFAPCHAFDATAAGTGKSKLFDCASILQTGRECAVVTQPEDKTEFEKKLFAFLLAGGGILNIDNCEQPLTSPFLCILLTQPFPQSRILGLSKNASIPSTTSTIGANGNNFSFTGDMFRRGLIGHLDAGMEKPWEREFKSPDPVEVFKRERPQLVAAALTVLLGYIHAGRPKQTAPPLGGFEGWCRMVRDPLLWLDCADPCATIDEVRQEDPEQQNLVEVLFQWREVLGERSLTTRQVVDEAIGGTHAPFDGRGNRVDYFHPEFRKALLDVAGERGFVSVERLGIWLREHKGKIAPLPNGTAKPENCRIVLDPQTHGFNRWRLQQQRDGKWPS